MSPTAWQRIFTAISGAATVFTLATEVAGVTVSLSEVSADAPVRLWGFFTVTTGVGATTLTPRIRRGGVAGTLVGAQPAITSPASSVVSVFNMGEDFPGEVASQTYTLSLTAAGVAASGILAYLVAVVG